MRFGSAAQIIHPIIPGRQPGASVIVPITLGQTVWRNPSRHSDVWTGEPCLDWLAGLYPSISVGPKVVGTDSAVLYDYTVWEFTGNTNESMARGTSIGYEPDPPAPLYPDRYEDFVGTEDLGIDPETGMTNYRYTEYWIRSNYVSTNQPDKQSWKTTYEGASSGQVVLELLSSAGAVLKRATLDYDVSRNQVGAAYKLNTEPPYYNWGPGAPDPYKGPPWVQPSPGTPHYPGSMISDTAAYMEQTQSKLQPWVFDQFDMISSFSAVRLTGPDTALGGGTLLIYDNIPTQDLALK